MSSSSSSGSSDDESTHEAMVDDGGPDMFLPLVVIAAFGCLDNYGDSSTKRPRKIPIITGIQWVEDTLASAQECYDMFRMRRSVFLRLRDTLVNNYGLKSTAEVNSKEASAMFVWTCGAPQSNRQVKNRFGHSKETVSRKFAEVLECVYRLGIDNIKPTNPQFSTIHRRLREGRFSPHFNNCIGAIDGTHVHVTVPCEKRPVHFNRHGYTRQMSWLFGDFDMRLTFVCTGWPGSAHDTRIFLNTLVTYKDCFPYPPEGKYYLVDSGYPNRKGYLAPYKNQRYCVPEFRNGGTPVGLKEVFNFHHSSLRNVIERAFGIWKMKWRILLKIPSYHEDKQKKIIVTTIALHNFIRDSALVDNDFARAERDEDYVDGDMSTNLSAHDVTTAMDDVDMIGLRDAIATALVA